MNKIDIYFICFMLIICVIIILEIVFMKIVDEEYTGMAEQCEVITHPELSVENEQKYNHCLSYPETYGISE